MKVIPSVLVGRSLHNAEGRSTREGTFCIFDARAMTVISWIIIVEEGGHEKVLDDHDYRWRRMVSAATYDKERTGGCPGLYWWAYISGLSQVGRRMDRLSSVLQSPAPGTFVGAQKCRKKRIRHGEAPCPVQGPPDVLSIHALSLLAFVPEFCSSCYASY